MGSALSWTDELATLLFIWLTMLGAVLAYRRSEHMRLTAFERSASPRVRAWLETISAAVVAIFCIELLYATLWPIGPRFSASYFGQQLVDHTPALHLARTWNVAAIVVGLVLILVLAITRLSDVDGRRVAVVFGAAVLLSLAAYASRGALVSLGNWNLVLFFVVLVGAFITIGVPIAFAFGVGTLSYLALATSVPVSTISGRMDEGIGNLVLLAVPLFVLLGLLMENAGIAKRLVDFIASFIAHVRGGLGIVLLFAMYLVSGISGSKAADMAAVAPVLFPEMERRGQERSEMIALLASSGAMAETIPPSLVLIIIGSVCGVSIAALFTAGLLPAAIAALALVVVVLLRSGGDRKEFAARPRLATIAKLFVIAIPGLALPLLIRAFVLGGVATATEVSTAGIIYVLLVGAFVYRELDWRRFPAILRETASLTGAIMLIIAAATAMGWALTQSGFAQQLADALGHAPGGKNGFMLLSVVLFIVLGSVLEGIPAIVLFGPLLFPIAEHAGINQVHYAIVVVLAMGVGLFAPPLGVGYYAACAIGRCEPDRAAGRIVPYLAALVVALLIVAFVPWISLGFLHTT
ncbi:MAG: TRAP transporter large permease subunit [Candidatus Eremiobacteraeota bacterium]|nr:TRAP transporter large permease subunit [Candidatus Eremiobacteraeota bacterium]